MCEISVFLYLSGDLRGVLSEKRWGIAISETFRVVKASRASSVRT
jgi:hypothetical protein